MKTKELIDEAFKLVSAIPVSGDHVEIMAAAKVKLREAYKQLEEEEKHGG